MSAAAMEKDKQLQEKLQVFIGELLKEEENKYCADCDAKGIASVVSQTKTSK